MKTKKVLCDFSLKPATMGIVGTLCDLLGPNAVGAGRWPGPCYLLAVTEEDAIAAHEIINNYYCRIVGQITLTKIRELD